MPYSEKVKHEAVSYMIKHGRKACLEKFNIPEATIYGWKNKGYGRNRAGAQHNASPRQPTRSTSENSDAKQAAREKYKHLLKEDIASNQSILGDLDNFPIEIERGVEPSVYITRSNYDGLFKFDELALEKWEDGESLLAFFVPNGYKGIEDVPQVLASQCTRYNKKYQRLGKKVKFSARRHQKELPNGQIISGVLVIRIA